MRCIILLCVSLCVSACNPLANTLSLAVTDDSGAPLANASATFQRTTNAPLGPSIRSGDAHSYNAITGSGGFASARISADHYVSVTVTHPQHYTSSVAVVDSGLSQHGTAATALPIPLKRITAPRPLIAKQAYVILPNLSGEAAYDFVVGDLVAPHGKGSSPDARFRWTRPADSSIVEKRRSWDMVFHTDGFGILAQRISNDSTLVRSVLRSERSAPAGSYLASLRSAETGAGFGERGASGEGVIYYLRLSRGGASLYGKILGEPRITFVTNNPRPVIQFTYAVNPAGDSSLEPELSAIRFPKANAYKQPYKLPEGS